MRLIVAKGGVSLATDLISMPFGAINSYYICSPHHSLDISMPFGAINSKRMIRKLMMMLQFQCLLVRLIEGRTVERVIRDMFQCLLVRLIGLNQPPPPERK